MSVLVNISWVLLSTAGTLCLLRVVRPGSVADRVVALDTLLVLIVTGIAVRSFTTRSGVYLDLLVVVSLLGFVGTVTVARFIERRGP